MPLVLLILGCVTSVAGLVLVASGLPWRESAFDVLTPGMIALVGGLLLVGLGFVVRELRRIEQGLGARPMAGATHAEHAIDTAEPDLAPAMPPPVPQAELQAAASVPAIEEAPAESMAVAERMRLKLPAIARAENGRLAEAADAAVGLRDASALDGTVAAVKGVAAAGRAANGAVPPARIVTRSDARPRPAAPAQAKASVFNTFWPPPPRRDGQTEPSRVSPPLAAEPPRPAAKPAPPPAAPSVTSGPLSVLKSGVVEGMAYTLYSDGSIEAQLPQGTLRFGSINALRHHIENSA